MNKTWLIYINTGCNGKEYKVFAPDSYDAKIEALKMFYADFAIPARLSDIDSCKEFRGE